MAIKSTERCLALQLVISQTLLNLQGLRVNSEMWIPSILVQHCKLMVVVQTIIHLELEEINK
jgi:hypothetical protein